MYTFAQPLGRALSIATGSPAVVCQDTRRTYAELGSRCRRLAGAMRKLGLAPHDRIRVVDTSRADVPPGTVGEIAVRSPSVMAGYWRNPHATAEVMLPGDWYLTGDLGYTDEASYLHLVDRAKDMIVSGKILKREPREAHWAGQHAQISGG